MKTLKLLLALGFVAGLIIEPVMAAAPRPYHTRSRDDANGTGEQRAIYSSFVQAVIRGDASVIFPEEGCKLPPVGYPEKRRLCYFELCTACKHYNKLATSCEHFQPRIFNVSLGEGYEQKDPCVPAFVSVLELVDGQAAVATGPIARAAGGAGAVVQEDLSPVASFPIIRLSPSSVAAEGDSDVDVEEVAVAQEELALVPYRPAAEAAERLRYRVWHAEAVSAAEEWLAKQP